MHLSDQVHLVFFALFVKADDFVELDHELRSLLLQFVYLVINLLILKYHARRLVLNILLEKFDSGSIRDNIINLIVQIVLLGLMRDLRQLNLLLFVFDLVFYIQNGIIIPMQLSFDDLILSVSPRLAHLVKRVQLLIVKFDFAIFANTRRLRFLATLIILSSRDIESLRDFQRVVSIATCNGIRQV